MQSNEQLQLQYDSMSARFLEQGLAVDSITQVRQRYQGSSKSLSPIPYSQFPEPLGADTVRLLVVPLAPQADKLVSSITELSRAFQAALPNGTECYINDAERWHITIFHTSKFDDTRPNPLQTTGNSLNQASAARPLPSPAALQQEQDAMQKTVAMSQALNFEVHRVLLADSGTLLVCLTDTDGHLSQLRQQLRNTFPAAPDSQTQIVHISVLRLLTAQQLGTEQRQRLQVVCDNFTSKLKGKKVTAQLLWYILERMFSNIEGTVHPMSTA